MNTKERDTSGFRRSLSMFTLIVTGEAVFFLPFVLPRIFRPTLLDVFQLTNFELGLAFSVYGIVAVLAYLPGGPLADWFSARKLMTCALLVTSLGGLYLATIPSLDVVKLLYGFWGVTTILLFWAPLIRATREWGDRRIPGQAFGALDGGRGLVAAIIGAFSVTMFALFMPLDVDSATSEERANAFQYVILLFSGVTFLAGLLAWFGLSDVNEPSTDSSEKFEWARVGRVLRMRTVWLQAIVVVCAYIGYRGLDDVSLFAREVLLFDEVQSARVGTLTMWVRPFAAVGAGVLADRWGVSRVTWISFLGLAIGGSVVAAGTFRPGMVVFFIATLITTSTAVFALRGLYFAMMEEGRVPFADTGSAVGIVSAIGFTPDIFMGPLTGIFLDRWPGERGHQCVFALVVVFALVGLFTSLLFQSLAKRID